MSPSTTPPGTSSAGSNVAFLVGAGRSGTTLLYKLLCLHPAIGYISNYDSRFPWAPAGVVDRWVAHRLDAKLQAWFNRGNAYFVDRPLFKKLFPTPIEGERIYARCGVPLHLAPGERPSGATAACLRQRFERLRERAGASVFLSKRTANNRRIAYLESIFPQARYIHLVRDGRDVAQSLSAVEWWDDHTVWWDGRTASEIERAGEPRLAICARNWVREIEELRIQLATVAPERRLELRFEELLRHPLSYLERILGFLGLDCPPEYRAAIGALGLRPVGARWGAEWTDQQLECVLRETQPLLRQLGYTK